MTMNWLKYRTKNEDWVIIRNLTDFKKTIEEMGVPFYISFDHDLSDINNETGEENSGMTCAKWLIDFCLNNDVLMCDFYTHSMNPCGVENITSILNNFIKFQKS